MEEKLEVMQRTMNDQTSILSNQNTVLKQILEMMNRSEKNSSNLGSPYHTTPSVNS